MSVPSNNNRNDTKIDIILQSVFILIITISINDITKHLL